MKRPALYVEPFAGAAAVFLRLVGGRRLQPPISWMGGKRRFASHILAAMGLRAGLGADRVLLADAGVWGWVWPVLLAPESRDRVVAAIRSWADEDPIQLWDRLRDTPPMSGGAERAAQWVWLQARAGSGVPVWWTDEAVLVQGDARKESQPAGQRASNTMRVDRSSQPHPTLVQSSGPDPEKPPTKAGQKTYSRQGCGGKIDIAGMGDDLAVLAETVATWCCLQHGGALGKEIAIRDGHWKTHGYAHLSDLARAKGFRERLLVEPLANKIGRLSVPLPTLGVYHGHAEDLVPTGDHEGTVVYLDPPYQGCTSYEADCPRESVLEIARRWSAAGAVVAVSEAVPLANELGDGWEAQEITVLGRRGCRPEWLTLNRPGAPRVDGQLSLWAGEE